MAMLSHEKRSQREAEASHCELEALCVTPSMLPRMHRDDTAP